MTNLLTDQARNLRNEIHKEPRNWGCSRRAAEFFEPLRRSERIRKFHAPSLGSSTWPGTGRLGRKNPHLAIPARGVFAVRMAHTPRIKWTRDELLIALNLYHKLTFGQMHARQPAIMALADKMGRGANSLAMKLGNFASLDPALKVRGIKGLSGASEMDRVVWTEFHSNLAELAPASETAFRNLFGADEESEVEVTSIEGVRVRKIPAGPTETTATVKVRRGQEYFRQAVLNNFGGRCGITGLAIRELLVASHILPWGKHENERLDVRNGLCLSRLHDSAFDIGLITFDENLRLKLSRKLKSALPQRAVAENFAAYEGQPLNLPGDAVLPDEKFLAEHHSVMFQK
jgi:putative restriction endonuclease